MSTDCSALPTQVPAVAEHTAAFREGNAFQEAARFAEALACYDATIALKPEFMEAHRNRGNALRQLGRLVEAVASFDQAIALMPSVAAYTNRGNVLRELKRTEEALESYDRALALNSHYAEIHNNRGSALQELGRLEEAAASYRRAIALKPEYAAAYNNLGVALSKLKRLDEAIASFDQAIELQDGYAEPIWNRGLAHLLTGEYLPGWRDYEARRRKKIPVADRSFPQPLWLGDAPLSGKTILVHWEQGFGDTIQFSRYLRLLADAGATVLFAPQRPLQRLMQTLDSRVQIVDLDAPLPPFDFHCPLLSLPLAFGTELQTIPQPRGYVHADGAQARAWRDQLGATDRPRIGVAWSGKAEPDPGRSMEFARFAALFDDRYQFVSLQKEVSEHDRPALEGAQILHLGDSLEDFADTAALCSLMDLVICVDTALAHLAGALAIPAWVLLPCVADWRWLLERSDTPWYPTLTLFRQPRSGDWDGALRQVQRQLTSQFGSWRRQ